MAANGSASSLARAEHEGAQATDFVAEADFTEETADQNPDWSLDLSDHEIGHWRGTQGRRGVITLVWGVALVSNGAVATAELGPDSTDQCELVDNRFHARLDRRLHGRLHRGAPVRAARRRAGARVALRRRRRVVETERSARYFLPAHGRRARGARVLLKFGELALKGRNRPSFVAVLERNLRRLSSDLGRIEIRRRGGVFIVTGGEPQATLVERCLALPGVSVVQPGLRCERDPSAAADAAIELLRGRPGRTFAVRTRRRDKRYPLRSMDSRV